jgi:hypothetical protein
MPQGTGHQQLGTPRLQNARERLTLPLLMRAGHTAYFVPGALMAPRTYWPHTARALRTSYHTVLCRHAPNLTGVNSSDIRDLPDGRWNSRVL